MQKDYCKVIQELQKCIESIGPYILKGSWGKVTQQYWLQILKSISDEMKAFLSSPNSKDMLINIKTLADIIIRLIVIAQLLNR